MSEITMSQVTELADPKLRKIAQRVAREFELAIDKVAATHGQPAKFTLASDSNSIERILAGRFGSLPNVRKQAAATKAITRIDAPIAVRKARYGDLAAVDLTKAKSVDAQVQAIPFPTSLKFPTNHLAALGNLHGSIVLPVGLTPQQMTNKLELRIHKVTCIDETDGFLGSEWGSDEIDLGGTTVDESGDTKKVAPFRVGSNFDDNDHKTYSPPKRFTFFELSEGTAFPKSYFTTLVLAEVDMGGLPDFLNELWKKVKEKVISALAAAIGAAIGASGGPVTAVIGAVVGYVVGEVFELLKSIWEDDVFKPVTVSVSIPSLNARWAGKTDSPESTAIFKGHGGKYRVTYDWRIFA